MRIKYPTGPRPQSNLHVRVRGRRRPLRHFNYPNGRNRFTYHAPRKEGQEPKRSNVPSPKPKSKYHARKIGMDGHQFDSKLEYRFYQFLRLSRAEFRCHPRFTVLDHSKWNKKHTYTPDFVTYRDGKIDKVYDCKGISRVPAYDHLRFELFAMRYHHHVTVVRWKHGTFTFKTWE